jgi:DNA-binding XRE family transcriptional regulator
MSERPNEPTLMGLRERASLTRRQLAEAIGVTEKTIFVWEKGAKEPKMTPSQMQAYTIALGCSFEEFIKAVQKRSPQTD